MPGTYTYPGVYIEEIPSGVRTIVGVSTSDTAFVDFFARGPVEKAVRITSFSEFERQFGGLDTRSEASYAVQQFYLNGGSVAWVVRITAGEARAATCKLYGGYGGNEVLEVSAASPGVWAASSKGGLEVGVDLKTKDPAQYFNLVVREFVNTDGGKRVLATEVHRNLSMDKTHARYAINVVNDASDLIRLKDLSLGELPAAASDADVINEPRDSDFTALGGSPSDGYEPGSTEWDNAAGEALKDGIGLLDRIAPYIFNILCIPAAARLPESSMRAVYSEAEKYCLDKRAFLILDIAPEVTTKEQMVEFVEENSALRHRNAAVYFPRLEIPDVLNENRPRDVGPSGTVAGLYAQTDSLRGVWKAPAGTEAVLRGATIPVKLTDLENGALNPLGVNVLRSFPVFGGVIWGARTLDGADVQASEWKYIPVRRMALYIEESLYQGLKWVVFEPNDEPLWAQIRLNVGAFMQDLFRQGAFQGRTPREAYFVKCDKETTTPSDVGRGIVNILVGFAPLRPAEFVVIKIQQMAGQTQT